jgi:hypothetical protein
MFLCLSKNFSLPDAQLGLSPGQHRITAVQFDNDGIITHFEVDHRVDVSADDLYEAVEE